MYLFGENLFGFFFFFSSFLRPKIALELWLLCDQHFPHAFKQQAITLIFTYCCSLLTMQLNIFSHLQWLCQCFPNWFFGFKQYKIIKYGFQCEIIKIYICINSTRTKAHGTHNDDNDNSNRRPTTTKKNCLKINTKRKQKYLIKTNKLSK